MRYVYILAAILIFGVLIAVHELGHFIAAKLCGVKVNEYSIGMGPCLWQYQGRETAYSLRAFPIGGYCAMEGEDEDTGDARSFVRQPIWKKLIILVAGSGMNFLTGLFIVLILHMSAVSFSTDGILSAFAQGFPLEGENGLQVNDVFYRIDGYRTYLKRAWYLGYDSDGNVLCHDRNGRVVYLDKSGHLFYHADASDETGALVPYGDETMVYQCKNGKLAYFDDAGTRVELEDVMPDYYTYWDMDASLFLQYHRGDTINLEMLRDGEKITLRDFPMTRQEYPTANGGTYTGFGVTLGYRLEPATLSAKLRYTWTNALDLVQLVRFSLVQLFTGGASVQDLSGPVGIVSTITEVGERSQSVSDAWKNIFYFAALIAVNLSVMNMLPIPALDGGRVFFLLIDAVSMLFFKRTVPERYQMAVNAAGMVLLLGFMFFITVQDVWKLFQ